MNQVKTLTDALILIQCVSETISAKKADELDSSPLNELLEDFKQQLSQDMGLPLIYFSPVNPDSEKVSSDEELQAENPQLTPEAVHRYQDLLLLV
ncbi:MAG: hypothetical protein WCI00_02335 [bacterium]